MRKYLACFGLALLGLLGLPAGETKAHPLDPSLLEITETADGELDILWREPTAAPRGLRLTPVLPESCRQLTPATRTTGEQRLSLRWRASCGASLVGLEVGVEGLRERKTDALLRVHLRDGRQIQTVLRGAQPYFTIPAEPGLARLGIDYARLGFDHILSGFDHLLFVLGLLFLVPGRRALLLTVTAFTLGHSITLSLAALGVVGLPSAPVEVAIAFSIFVLALQLAAPGWPHPAAAPASDRGAPWRMAAAFGLLHGFGFAGALREAGLPGGDVPWALFSFNLGIELGQILFLGSCLLALNLAARLAERRAVPTLARLRLLAAYLIGPLAVYWILERGSQAFFPPG